MTPLAIALAVAVLALLWWAAKPLNRNHAARDERHTAQVKANAERTAKSTMRAAHPEDK